MALFYWMDFFLKVAVNCRSYLQLSSPSPPFLRARINRAGFTCWSWSLFSKLKSWMVVIVFVPFLFFRTMILLTAGNNSFSSRVEGPYEIRPESKQKKLQNTYLERTVLRKDLGASQKLVLVSDYVQFCSRPQWSHILLCLLLSNVQGITPSSPFRGYFSFPAFTWITDQICQDYCAHTANKDSK